MHPSKVPGTVLAAPDHAAASVQDTQAEDGGRKPQSLLRRLEAALRDLAEGKSRVAHGLTAVGELRQRLGDVAPRLGIDLRGVQESVVEHAATYAKSPEVLGCMLKLVWCLDLVSTWLGERDASAAELERRLNSVEGQIARCDATFADVRQEVKSCCESVAALDAQKEQEQLQLQSRLQELQHQLEEQGREHDRKLREQLLESQRKVQEQQEHLQERLQQLRQQHDDEKQQWNKVASEQITRALSDKAARSSGGAAEAEAAEAAAWMEAEHRAMPPRSAGGGPVQALLLGLEQLEPSLASLPVGILPGMLELQEEACEAYTRLRDVLFEAAELPGGGASLSTLPGQICSRSRAPAWATVAVAAATALAASSGGSASLGGGYDAVPMLDIMEGPTSLAARPDPSRSRAVPAPEFVYIEGSQVPRAVACAGCSTSSRHNGDMHGVPGGVWPSRPEVGEQNSRRGTAAQPLGSSCGEGGSAGCNGYAAMPLPGTLPSGMYSARSVSSSGSGAGCGHFSSTHDGCRAPARMASPAASGFGLPNLGGLPLANRLS